MFFIIFYFQVSQWQCERCPRDLFILNRIYVFERLVQFLLNVSRSQWFGENVRDLGAWWAKSKLVFQLIGCNMPIWSVFRGSAHLHFSRLRMAFTWYYLCKKYFTCFLFVCLFLDGCVCVLEEEGMRAPCCVPGHNFHLCKQLPSALAVGLHKWLASHWVSFCRITELIVFKQPQDRDSRCSVGNVELVLVTDIRCIRPRRLCCRQWIVGSNVRCQSHH